MTKRIYTHAEIIAAEGSRVDVDCPQGTFRDAVLVGVNRDGSFEISTENADLVVCDAPAKGMTKIFVLEA